MVFVTVIVLFKIQTPNLNWEINVRRSLTEHNFDPKAVHFHSVKLDSPEAVCFVVMIG